MVARAGSDTGLQANFSRGAGKSVGLGESGRIGEAKYGGDTGPAFGRVCHVRSKNEGATSNGKLSDPGWYRRGSVQDCLRRLPTAGQRRLDSPHVWAGIQLAGKEYPVAARSPQHRRRFTCFRRRVGIGPRTNGSLPQLIARDATRSLLMRSAGGPNVSASETGPMSMSSASVSDDMPSALGPRGAAGRPSSSRETTCA